MKEITQDELNQKLGQLKEHYTAAKAEADKVPALQGALDEANRKVASLEENQKNASNEDAALDGVIKKVASVLRERNILKSDEKADEWIKRATENPSEELSDSFSKVASFASAVQMGEAQQPAPDVSKPALDPISQFAVS